ncbi:MAG TPA: hypothetical protein PKD12_08160 [Nitrospira sp.]|nr:hypothetical protein [Nitrospira sp.]
MDLYTLDSSFRKKDVIDEFVSAIWTERFLDAGDLVLSVDATQENRTKLAEGTFVALVGTDQVMLIESQDVQNNILKVTGNTLDAFLNSRVVIDSSTLDNAEYAYTMTPGALMEYLIDNFAAHGGPLGAPLGISNWGYQAIPWLFTGLVAAGTAQTFSVKRGPLFDAIKEIGNASKTGWKLVPINVTDASYTLDFSSYVGRNLCSDQSTYPLVRFSPSLDSLADVKELRSMAGYKTICWAISPGFDAASSLAGGSQYTGQALAYPGALYENGFSRRSMLVEIRDITAANVGNSFATYKSVMDGYARDALANNNYTKVVDGEVVPQSEFKYGVDYFLGDLLELQDQYDFIQKATVTEYIRTQDASGYREYPTIAVANTAYKPSIPVGYR